MELWQITMKLVLKPDVKAHGPLVGNIHCRGNQIFFFQSYFCSISATFQVNLSVATRLCSAQHFTVGINGHLVPWGGR